MTESGTDDGNARAAEISEKRGFSIIWLIPLVAVAVGAYLAYDAISSQGPTITITFETAEGLTAGKTRIKFKAVDAGTVDSIEVAKDLSHVIVTCSMVKDSNGITEGARFWVVRPRIGAGGISGLGTIVSGAYIAIEPGPLDGKPAREFKGLEKPPIAPEESPGLKVVLHADQLGGVDVGSPVLYREVEVGKIEGREISEDGKGVQFDVYIEDEHAQRVTSTSRFWNASGVSVSAGIGGVHVKTESVEALLVGGIAFDSPHWGKPEPAKAGASYWLHESFADLEEAPYRYGGLALVVEAPMLGSLKVGDRVYYREEPVGAVTSHSLSKDSRSVRIHLNIMKRHGHLVRANSVFWNASGISANLGLKGLHIHTESLQALLAGGIGFASPNSKGAPVKPGSVFQLYAEPKEEWTRWPTPGKHEGMISRFFHHFGKGEEEAADDHDPDEPHPTESKKHGFFHKMFHGGS